MATNKNSSKLMQGINMYGKVVGRTCAIAWQNAYTDYKQTGAKSIYVEHTLKHTHTSKLILNYILSPELKHNHKLVGIGKESIVLRSGNAPYVIKKSIDAYGANDMIINKLSELYKHNNQLLLDIAGDGLYVPTIVEQGKLTLNPLLQQPTVILKQKYIDAAYSIFDTPEKVINTSSFQEDLENLIETIANLQVEGEHLSVMGYGNVVVERGSNHLRIVDSGLLMKCERKIAFENYDQVRKLRR